MVEWKKIKDIGDFYGGLSGKSKEDFSDGNAKFVTYMNVFKNEKLNTDISETVKVGKNEKQNKVQYSDVLFTGSSETPDECGMSSVVCHQPKEDVYLNSFCFGLRWKDEGMFNPVFLSHFLRSSRMRKAIARTANGVTRFNVSKKLFANIEIPIIAKEEQKRIGEELDTFTSLISKLDEEIALRKKQYEHYRNHLLSFEGRDDVEWNEISSNCSIERGKRVVRKDLDTEGVIPVYQNSLIPLGYYSEYNCKAGKTIVIGAGSAGSVAYIDKDFWAADDCYFFSEVDVVNQKFLYYYLSKEETFLKSQVRKGSVPRLSRTIIEKVKVPLPTLSEQHQIVEELDAMTSLISALEQEKALRQKQYEYYREKLLTFE